MNANATTPAVAPQTTRYTFQLRGMTCAACSARLQRKLASLDGVTRANVNLATHMATVVAVSTVDEATVKSAV